ncbi:HlyD family secretion protein [Bosea caraganae]|uniref:HlyD family secretion protein n=1 Tax=Bosea caraganae TaxID=2763117 RepID=A0A370LBR6_9HYPH|nr:HlyD family secretion protein [Bosea caraganae]RDJ27401.1 HlyD family secretion protein [Bosea caraganae]RDJ29417.1 HlyD family secretion protein [Bosea caraganae]
MTSETEAEAAVPAPAPANPLRKVALGVLLAIVVLFAVSIVMERLTPSSSQAVVQAYVVRMAPDVAGRVTEVNVTDNERVEAGKVLFRIDARPFEIAVTEAQAQVERIGQTIGASTAAVESAQARLVKAGAEFENVRAQSQRTLELVQRGILALSKADEAKAALNGSRAAVTGAEADLAKAREDLGPQGAENPQLRAALAALERARLNLLHTTVSAPALGVVTNLQLATGQFIGAGQSALTFIDASSIWVSANFKENSLEHMSMSDRAEVVFDSLPGVVFPAKVESIGWGVSQGSVDPATGLPTIRNDSGWVRDPQRFPVRLIVEGGPPRGIRFGSQVNVVVYTGSNPVANALGAFWIRLVSVLTYAT